MMAIDRTPEPFTLPIRPRKLHFVSTKVIDSELRKSPKIFLLTLWSLQKKVTLGKMRIQIHERKHFQEIAEGSVVVGWRWWAAGE
jgi:hypothetical protein